jgi:hypothetical protein
MATTSSKMSSSKRSTRDLQAARSIIPEGWLFRIVHNASLDFLRNRARIKTTQLDDESEIGAASQAETPDADVLAASFHTFLQLPVLQRCAVILKDVLGHSVEEIAAIAACGVPAAKSALQRGRANLKTLTTNHDDVRLPLLSDDERARLLKFVEMFRAGNFDSVRQMLADDVKLDLVARLKVQGREKIGQYFTRYPRRGTGVSQQVRSMACRRCWFSMQTGRSPNRRTSSS